MLVVIPYLILPVGFFWEKLEKKSKIPVIALLILGIIIQIPSIMVNISRYYYEINKKFGSQGHEKLLFSFEESPLIGQFKQVAEVYAVLGNASQVQKMVAFAKEKKNFLSENVSVVLKNGLAINSLNFWWYYMWLFGYSFLFWLVPPVLFLSIMIITGYKLIKETRRT